MRRYLPPGGGTDKARLAWELAIRHAESNDVVSRDVATLIDTPRGQAGRPSKSLNLDQAVGIIAAARLLPPIELRPGLIDVRRPAELMYAYIVLSLLVGLRTEEARALRWDHIDLDSDPMLHPPCRRALNGTAPSYPASLPCGRPTQPGEYLGPAG